MDFFLILTLAIFIAFLTTFGFLGWMWHCNDQTYKQRSALLAAIWTAPPGMQEELIAHFEKISYIQHARCLQWFGDWHRLYHPLLLATLESETKAAGESFKSAVRAGTINGAIVP